jgi:hypothetical protein
VPGAIPPPRSTGPRCSMVRPGPRASLRGRLQFHRLPELRRSLPGVHRLEMPGWLSRVLVRATDCEGALAVTLAMGAFC